MGPLCNFEVLYKYRLGFRSRPSRAGDLYNSAAGSRLLRLPPASLSAAPPPLQVLSLSLSLYDENGFRSTRWNDSHARLDGLRECVSSAAFEEAKKVGIFCLVLLQLTRHLVVRSSSVHVLVVGMVGGSEVGRGLARDELRGLSPVCVRE